MVGIFVSDVEQIKKEKSAIVSKYAKSNDLKAIYQILTTVVPYFLLFYIAIESISISYWLTAAYISLLILFLLRVFMMMHDCGHDSLFVKSRTNRLVGFVMGVLCGIPQYVWSKHHAYHHSTNGNWNKYRGPLSVLSSEEYALLSPKKKKSYQNSRKIIMAPVGGFLYFIFNPRYTWAKGSVDFFVYLLSSKFKNKPLAITDIINGFETKYWATWKEYWHMTANNIVLLSSWGLAGWYFGWVDFFIVYITVISLSGALGIILFTIQHNFEDSYASGDKDWDYYAGALEGSSYLDLPKVLHWFTADIGYHHVHHLFSRMPNYNLVACHNEYAHLFKSVKRIRLSEVGEAFKYILWDESSRRIISIAQYDEKAQQSISG
ncbi:MAG: fatty acid desaturase [Gammaproteobacteria bacterium]|nr:fatty acid desaturase [Gammaproteobacteria bacterium]